MNHITLITQKDNYELINEIKKTGCDVTELKDNNFDGDPTMLTLLIAITPVIVDKLGKVIEAIIQNPSNGKIKINGLEIEGFTYEETINLLDKISTQKEVDER